MKKQLLLILSLLAVSTAAFAGCTTPTNDKAKTNVDKEEIIQEKENSDDDGCEDGNCGSDHRFIQPRTPRIRKDRTTDENGDQVPPPCHPKEPHKDDGRHIPAPPPAPKPMPVPQPQN